MWHLYLLAPAAIRMGIRVSKMCELFLFFSLNFTAFVSAKLGRSEFMKIMQRNFFCCVWDFSDSNHSCLLMSCQYLARPLSPWYSLWVFGRSLYTRPCWRKLIAYEGNRLIKAFLDPPLFNNPIDKYGSHIFWIFLGVSTEINFFFIFLHQH